MVDSPPRILLVVAPYYRDIAARLVAGAQGHLESEGAETKLVEVPGALEIPPAIRRVHDRFHDKVHIPFDGYVALGCVIRGETSHYEIVAGESARGLMELGIGGGGARGLPIGNGILTVDNRDQALARTAKGRNKGEEAARACLSLVSLGRKLAL